jgi:hypothetical protein
MNTQTAVTLFVTAALIGLAYAMFSTKTAGPDSIDYRRIGGAI